MSERKKILFSVVITSVATFLLTLVMVFGLIQVLLISNYQGLGNLAEVYRLMKAEGLQTVSDKNLVAGAVKGMVGSLDDPYSVYLEPKSYKDLNAKIKGSFGGVGIVVEMKENRVTVLSVIKGTPAEKAGVKANDVVTKIDGKDTTNMDLDTAAGMIRGQEGTKVKLTVFRHGVKNLLDFEMQRKVITVPSVEGEIISGTKIALIKINSFTSGTGSELKETVEGLKKQGMQGIILDMRNNPGGDLIAATEVADLFVPKGPIVYIDYRSEEDEVYNASGNNLKLPLAVLINEGSASAAEIVAGAIKDTGAGTLVGTKTFGKGVVQTIYDLKDGAGLKLTTARYLTPKKKNINKIGINPDVVVKQPENSQKDLQLDKAKEIISSKLK